MITPDDDGDSDNGGTWLVLVLVVAVAVAVAVAAVVVFFSVVGFPVARWTVKFVWSLNVIFCEYPSQVTLIRLHCVARARHC